MARDHDKQLLESVATRRERLRAAFLHGDLGARRETPDNMKRFVTSVVLGAVACAGCAGFSFVRANMAEGGLGVLPQQTQQQTPDQRTEQPASSAPPGPSASPADAQADSPTDSSTDPPTDGATAP